MQLEKYRKSKKYSYKKLAEIIGVTGKSPQATIFRWCKKERLPRFRWMKLIKEKTRGKVQPSSFYE